MWRWGALGSKVMGETCSGDKEKVKMFETFHLAIISLDTSKLVLPLFH